MTPFDDADDNVGDPTTPMRSFRQILVEKALKKAMTPAIVASCIDDQIIVLVDAPTDNWASALMGPISRLYEGRQGQIKPFIFKRSPPRKTGAAKEDPDHDTFLLKLLSGTSVIGVFSPSSAPLPGLQDNPDLRVEIMRPDRFDVAEAISEATGSEVSPESIPVLNTLDLDALSVAIRPRAPIEHMLNRLRSLSIGRKPDDEAIPRLEQLAGYGHAMTWALSVQRTLDRIRSGDPEVTLADLPRGALMVGPAGVGKSIFARSFAKTLNIPSVITSVSDWMGTGDTHLGTVIKAARTEIEKARSYQPGFLFIDEVDSIVDRDLEKSDSASWWLNFVNSVLTAIDGAIKSPGLIVVGACNNLQRVDKALRRSGRLETIVNIGLPNEADRLSILKFYVKDAISTEALRPCAARSAGMSGADLQRAVREAKQIARDLDRLLTAEHLLRAMAPRDVLSDDVLITAARHEAGHALANLLLGDRLLAVDVERGVTHLAPSPQILDKLAVDHVLVTLMAGRAADMLLGGKVNGGAGGAMHSDLGQATALAAARHGSLGLGETLTFIGAADEAIKLVQTDQDLRGRVERDLQDAFAAALSLLARHEAVLAALAQELLYRKFMRADDIAAFVSAKIEVRS